jgi:hypothetical protein
MIDIKIEELRIRSQESGNGNGESVIKNQSRINIQDSRINNKESTGIKNQGSVKNQESTRIMKIDT